MAEYVNKFGRKPGRGMRSWLLIPKVFAVAIYFGGLVATAGLWFLADFAALEPTDPQRAWLVDTMAGLFVYVTVPGLLLTLAFGLALWAQHRQAFTRMRWWRAKIAMIVVGVPAGHLFMSSKLGLLREAVAAGEPAHAAVEQFNIGLVVTIVWFAVIIVLGRLKPRLNQPTIGRPTLKKESRE